MNISVSNICIPPSLISIVTKNKKIRDEKKFKNEILKAYESKIVKA